MNPWCYLIMLWWVAGGVFRGKGTGIWLLVLVAVALSGLVAISLNGSVLPSLPDPLLTGGMIASSLTGAVVLAWALLPAGYEAGRPKESKPMGRAHSATLQR